MYEKFGKRAADIALSSIALVILFPILVILALAIKLDSRGPALFRQKRFGKDKGMFYIYKFRTMYADAPGDVPTDKMKDAEKHITRMGRVLRKTSLDELPQIINILKGEMSIIGPRPALWNQDNLIALRDKYDANRAVPGLTGLAQVNGRDELDEDEKARYDGYYASHISLEMDIKCFLKTFISVVKCEGVVEGSNKAPKST
ncbi:MAG: sugar transferase [Clostridia bacterium]|nr:sugar transferase [Clostridia bacterium]